MKKYTTLIIDIKNSKSYSVPDRNSIQQNIIKALQNLNKIFTNSLEKEVEFSAGDEVQGLFSSSIAAYLYLRLFKMMINPIDIWAGIGIGNWDVIVQNASTTAQDGSAYHNARKAIDETKKSLEYSTLVYSGKKNDFIINSLINSIELIIKKQSEKQNEIMFLTEIYYPITAHEVINIKEIKNLFNFINKELKDLHIDNFEPIPTNALENNNFFIASGKKRGISTQLSEILEISRQSIEKTIKTANIFEIRNLLITTLNVMKEYD